MKIPLLILCCTVSLLLQGQPSKLVLGLEQDALPYLLNGHFINAWVGKDHLRSRILWASVLKPDFLLPEGFTNNRVNAYAVTADYFPKKEWEGYWISAGAVLWKNTVQTDLRKQIAHFNTYLLNGSIGYSWMFYKHFYLSPWAGMHLRVGGHTSISVDGKIYKPPFLNPEASVKVGWYF